MINKIRKKYPVDLNAGTAGLKIPLADIITDIYSEKYILKKADLDNEVWYSPNRKELYSGEEHKEYDKKIFIVPPGMCVYEKIKVTSQECYANLVRQTHEQISRKLDNHAVYVFLNVVMKAQLEWVLYMTLKSANMPPILTYVNLPVFKDIVESAKERCHCTEEDIAEKLAEISERALENFTPSLWA